MARATWGTAGQPSQQQQHAHTALQLVLPGTDWRSRHCCAFLPCPPLAAVCRYHFYEQFLSVETTCLQDHHRSTGQMNFRASRYFRAGMHQLSWMGAVWWPVLLAAAAARHVAVSAAHICRPPPFLCCIHTGVFVRAGGRVMVPAASAARLSLCSPRRASRQHQPCVSRSSASACTRGACGP